MTPIELRWWLGALAGGVGCGLAGFLLLSLDLPFLAVCLAHAALAGAVIGQASGISPTLCAFVGSLLASIILGPASDRLRMQVATLTSILFSLSLGLAFLVLGLSAESRSASMALLWGNLLLLDWPRLAVVCIVCLVGLAAALVFRRPLKAALFSRSLAWSCGLPAGAIIYATIAWCGLAITVNLEAIGGLMLYSLLINPAAAARQLTDRFNLALFLSIFLAALSSAGGLGLAIVLQWPAGASIVLASTAVFLLSAVWRALAPRRASIA
ncbi:MAG: metal ABC transporter permease [Opitutaceae bacterium]|jgi:manganese/iron transport system permease protein